MTAITSIIAELVAAIGLAMSHPAMVVAQPRVERLEPEVLQQRVCGRPCRVLAWYGPDGVIYLDERIDPSRNVVAKSILLHELVHHVQRQAVGKNAGTCKEWLERERQAYRIQANWLFEQGIDASPLTWQARTVKCNPLAPGLRALRSSEAN